MCWRRKLKLSAASLAVGTLAWLFVAPALVMTPPLPEKWHKLRPGMTRIEATFVIGQLSELRELKGFDSRTEELEAYARGYWNLELRYNKFGHLTNAEARFIDRKFGPFSSEPLTLF